MVFIYLLVKLHWRLKNKGKKKCALLELEMILGYRIRIIDLIYNYKKKSRIQIIYKMKIEYVERTYTF